MHVILWIINLQKKYIDLVFHKVNEGVSEILLDMVQQNFIKMKVKALKSVLPRFAHFQFPDADTAWFEIYFSEPVNSRFTIRQAFVVDKRIADGEAYLVLTVPRGKVESYIPDITAIKNTVNRAFDEGKPINLKKYIDVEILFWTKVTIK